MSVAPLAVAAAEGASLARRADPLAAFRFKNWAARKLAEKLGEAEIYWHSGNRGGKSTSGAALAVAMLRGEPALDGTRLPVFGRRVVGAVVVPSYGQSAAATLQSLRDMIGDWPHLEVHAGGPDAVSSIHVRQRGSTSGDTARWSVLHVVPHTGPGLAGGNFDFVWADEPPPMWLWREAAMRFRSRSTFAAYVTATPLYPLDSARGAGWKPLLERFEDCLGRSVGGRLRLQSSIYDNEALSAEDVRRAEERAKGDPLERARLMGEHVNASGSCPWPADVLERWMDRTRPPDEVIRLVVQRELGPGLAPIEVSVETWGSIDPQDVYIVLGDPARGQDDGEHDPDGAHVWSMRRKALVARVNGYIGGWGLGLTLERLARAYNDARIGVLGGGGYGLPVLSALRQRKWRHYLPDIDPGSSRLKASAKLDLSETKETRGRALGALEQALRTGDAEIPSREVIQSLMDCVIDAKGKILAGPRGHDEDMILAGWALETCQSRPPQAVAEPVESPSVAAWREGLRLDLGRDLIGPPRRPPGELDLERA